MPNSSVPSFRRERIEAARQAAQQDQNQKPPATAPQPGEPGQDFAHQGQPNVDQQKDDNDAAAWKGRLIKTQEELRAERDELNRIRVEALTAQNEAREARERFTQTQRELEEANQRLAGYVKKEQENFLSDEEKRQLSETFGEDATDILTKVIAKVRPTTPSVDVNTAIDKRFQEMSAQSLEREWAQSVKAKIPEAHTLRADPEFIQFAQSKSDWFGNTALSVMDDIGAKRDVHRLGFISDLINEFKAYKNPQPQEPTGNTTVPPRNNNQSYSSNQSGNGKKKIPSEDFYIAINNFKVRGDTKGLRAYLAEHEASN